MGSTFYNLDRQHDWRQAGKSSTANGTSRFSVGGQAFDNADDAQDGCGIVVLASWDIMLNGGNTLQESGALQRAALKKIIEEPLRSAAQASAAAWGNRGGHNAGG